VAAADLDARRARRNQRRGDAVLVLAADQVVRVVEFEREAQDRRDRGERDVALVPVQANADDLFAFPFALADDAGVDQRRGVGAGLRRGQCETRDLGAVGQAGQVALFLRVGAVVQE
jgi:hypothetical protein